jgi:BTB/POZ domain
MLDLSHSDLSLPHVTDNFETIFTASTMAEASQESGNEILNEGSASSKKSVVDDIDVTITESILGLQKLFKQREKELDERAGELERLKVALEREHPTFGAKPSDVLRLNVGGNKIDVFRRTLTSVEGSLLASQFSGRWDDSLAKDADGNFFLDHPIELFLVLVNYLRDRECETQLAPPLQSPLLRSDDVATRIRFVRMLEHYNLTLGVYPFSLYRVESNDDHVPVCKGVYPGASIRNTTGSPESYALYRTTGCEHRFHVKTFEVEIESGSKAYVGVSHGSSLATVLQAHKEGAGVGYVAESIAVDVARHGIAYLNARLTATFSLIEGMELSDSTHIRCEDFGGKWFVNGKLVASRAAVSGAEGLVDITSFAAASKSTTRPVVTLHKGSLRVTAIELEWIN